MQEILTNELNDILEKTHPEQLDTYFKENRAYLADEKKGFYYYMKDVLAEKKIKLKDVYSFAGVSESYGSKVMSMEKRTRDRDLIITFCAAGRFTLQETNRALKLYGMSELYAKEPRDACLIVAFNNRIYQLCDIDARLAANGFAILTAKHTMDE